MLTYFECMIESNLIVRDGLNGERNMCEKKFDFNFAMRGQKI